MPLPQGQDNQTVANSRLIAVLLLTEKQDFQRAQAQSAREVCEREGYQVEIVFSDNSPFMQIRQALEFVARPLASRPAAIAIELAGASAAFTKVARAALAAGVGWVELSSGASAVEALRREFPGRLVATVTADEVSIGELHAAQCRRLLPKGGGLLYVEGPGANSIVKARRLALERSLAGTTITIVKTLAADWTEDGAIEATIAWLQQPSSKRICPDLICSQNDAMAVGVRMAAAAQRASWAGVPTLGCDGVATVGQRYVKEGTLAATIIKPVTAGPAVDWIVRAIRGETLPRHLVLLPTSFPAVEVLARDHGEAVNAAVSVPPRRSKEPAG